MKKYYLFVLLSIIVVSASAQKWSYRSGNGVPGSTYTVKIAESTYISPGSNIILRTENAGLTWQEAVIEDNSLCCFSYATPTFISETHGWSLALRGSTVTTVIKTTDGGKTWQPLPTQGVSNLLAPTVLHFFDANRAILVGVADDFSFPVYQSLDGGSTWKKTGSTLGWTVSASFLGDIGYLAASNSLLKTTDGGTTWTEQVPELISNDQTGQYQTVATVDIVSATEAWAAGSGNALFKTVNGGESWQPVVSSYNKADAVISAIDFIDSQKGYITNTAGYVKFTNDGGTTWQNRHTPPQSKNDPYIVAVNFDDDGLTGYVADYETPGILIFTTDGGLTWTPAPSPLAIPQLHDIAFQDTNHGWAVGAGGTVVKTSNGGKNWQHAPIAVNGDIKSITIQNPQTVWAAGEDGILKKTNDHDFTVSTETVIDDFDKSYEDIFFLHGKNRGWAVGADSRVIHYNGTLWVKQAANLSELLTLKSVFFFDENTGWITGEKGTILKTTDGGQSWAPLTTGILRALNDVFFVDTQTGWAVGDHEYILKSVDGGATWYQQSIPAGYVTDLHAVHFTSPHRGWVAGKHLYTTSNGGHTWTIGNPENEDSKTSIFFFDHNHAWAVDEIGGIYQYTDNLDTSTDTSVPFAQLYENPFADTLYNFNVQEHALIDSAVSIGKLFGRSTGGREEFAEKYIIDEDAFVAGMIVYHGGTFANAHNIGEYNVFDVDALGFPDRKLGRKDVYFEDMNLNQEAYRIMFDHPVAVRDSFFISFNLTDYSHGGFTGDDIGVMHTSNNSRPETDMDTRNVVRVHDHSGRAWRTAVSERRTQGYRGHLALFPIVYRKNIPTGLEHTLPSAGILTLPPAYPNPATDQITIQLSVSKPAQASLTVLNMQGQSMLTKRLGRLESGLHQEQLNVGTLRPGLYIYKIQAGNASLSSKFVIH